MNVLYNFVCRILLFKIIGKPLNFEVMDTGYGIASVRCKTYYSLIRCTARFPHLTVLHNHSANSDLALSGLLFPTN